MIWRHTSTRLMRSSVAGGVSRRSSCIDFHPRRAIQLFNSRKLPVHRLLRVLPMNSAYQSGIAKLLESYSFGLGIFRLFRALCRIQYRVEMNWLKTPLFIAHFNFANDMSYEGLHELRKSQNYMSIVVSVVHGVTLTGCRSMYPTYQSGRRRGTSKLTRDERNFASCRQHSR
jgi:hypothetical protein